MQELLTRLDRVERRLDKVEAAVEAGRSTVEGLQAIANHLVEQSGRFNSRVSELRDMMATHETRILELFSDHERREQERRDADQAYRREREDREIAAAESARRDARRDRTTNLLALAGNVATLGAVVLAWWLGKF